MPRASREQQAANHRRILEQAACLVRERGSNGFSVAEVMAAAGLTHGAFYKHFASRDDLIARAGAVAFGERKSALAGVVAGAPTRAAARAAWIDAYLSTGHRDHLAEACPAAALAADVGRPGVSDDVRESYLDGVHDVLATLQNLDDDRMGEPLVELATLVGAVLLARATTGDDISERFLDAAREHLTARGRSQVPEERS